MNDMLELNCAEWREVAEENPSESEVIMEMLIDAGEQICDESDA
ncbi:MAG: hypothetical protein ABFS23_04995 [Pseudomonadota bacterium]